VKRSGKFASQLCTIERHVQRAFLGLVEIYEDHGRGRDLFGPKDPEPLVPADDESGAPVEDDRLDDPKAIHALAERGERGLIDSARVVGRRFEILDGHRNDLDRCVLGCGAHCLRDLEPLAPDDDVAIHYRSPPLARVMCSSQLEPQRLQTASAP